MLLTTQQALLNYMATNGRTVLSPWRSLIALRNATWSIPHHERRWTVLPWTNGEALRVLRTLEESQQVKKIGGSRNLFQSIGPYAVRKVLDEREVLFESNPYAWLSHASAIEFHYLTSDQPKGIVASFERVRSDDVFPIGTSHSDFEGLALPNGYRPSRVLRTEVTWHGEVPGRLSGIRTFEVSGLPYRYTTIERTLLDALENPGLSGGWTNVMRAWRGASDRININTLVELVESANKNILRQRVGYLLEQLGFHNSNLDAWQSGARRGGSSKLDVSEPYSPEFSERWSLSLNVDNSILHELVR